MLGRLRTDCMNYNPTFALYYASWRLLLWSAEINRLLRISIHTYVRTLSVTTRPSRNVQRSRVFRVPAIIHPSRKRFFRKSRTFGNLRAGISRLRNARVVLFRGQLRSRTTAPRDSCRKNTRRRPSIVFPKLITFNRPAIRRRCVTYRNRVR